MKNDEKNKRAFWWIYTAAVFLAELILLMLKVNLNVFLYIALGILLILVIEPWRFFGKKEQFGASQGAAAPAAKRILPFMTFARIVLPLIVCVLANILVLKK